MKQPSICRTRCEFYVPRQEQVSVWYDGYVGLEGNRIEPES